MNLKRRTVALASAVLVAALVGPAGADLAARPDIEGAGVKLVPLVRHDPAEDGGENRESSADNPGDAEASGDAEPSGQAEHPGEAEQSREAEHSGDREEPREPGNPGDIEIPGELENPGDIGIPGDAEDPDDHDDPGDGGEDPRDNGSCTSVSSVAVCFDQPR